MINIYFECSVLIWGDLDPVCRTGVYRVVNELFKNLLSRDDINLILVADDSYITPSQAEDYFYKNGYAPFSVPFSELFRFYNRPITFLKNKLNRSKNIYFSPFLPMRSRLLRQAGFKGVTLIYDTIAISHPEWAAETNSKLIEAVVKSIDKDDLVFTISENTKIDLLKLRPDIPEKNLKVIPLSASSVFTESNVSADYTNIRTKYGLGDFPYLLSVATIEPRKNLQRVIRSFAMLKARHPQLNWKLALVGTKGWGCQKYIDEVAMNNDVIALGFIPDEDLAGIYRLAEAFVYVSLYEGFGLPPLEAMSCGLPVITSNTSSLPEVVGDAAILVDPLSESEISNAMEKIFLNKIDVVELKARSLERAKLFSWNKTFAQFMDGLEKL